MSNITIPITSNEIDNKITYLYIENGAALGGTYNFFGNKTLKYQYKDVNNVDSAIKTFKYFINYDGVTLDTYDEYIDIEMSQVDYDNFKFSIPSVKYNKDLVVALTLDDGLMGQYNKVFTNVHGLVVNSTDTYNESVNGTDTNGTIGFNGYFDDGCGKKVYPTFSLSVPESVVKPTVVDSTKFTSWQMKRMYRFGNDITLGLFDITNTSSQDLTSNVSSSITTVMNNYKTLLGYYPIGMVTPGIKNSYINTFYLSNTPIMTCKTNATKATSFNINNIDICKHAYERFDFTTTTSDNLISNLPPSDKATPYVLYVYSNTNYTNLNSFLQYVSNGTNNILVCSPEDLYEYLYFKKSISIQKTYSNGKCRLRFKGSIPSHFKRRELTLLVNNTTTTGITYSTGVYSFSSANISTSIKQINLSISDYKVERLNDVLNDEIVNNKVDYSHDKEHFFLSLTPEKRTLFPTLVNLYSNPIINSITQTNTFGYDVTFTINTTGLNINAVSLRNPANGDNILLPYIGNNSSYTYKSNIFGNNTIYVKVISDVGESNETVFNFTTVRPSLPYISSVNLISNVDNIISFDLTTTGYSQYYQIYEAPVGTTPELVTPVFTGTTSLISYPITHSFLQYGNNTLFIKLSSVYDESNIKYINVQSIQSPAPVINSFVINNEVNGNVVGNILDITINADNTIYVAFSLINDFTNATWLNYSSSLTYTMPNTSGTYTLYYAAKNNSNTTYGSAIVKIKEAPTTMLVNFDGSVTTSIWNQTKNCTDICPTTTVQNFYYNGVVIGQISSTKTFGASDITNKGYSTGNNSGVYPDYYISTNAISSYVAPNGIVTLTIKITNQQYVNKLMNIKLLSSTVSNNVSEKDTTFYIGSLVKTPIIIYNNYYETIDFYSLTTDINNSININYSCTQGGKTFSLNLLEIEFNGDIPTTTNNTLSIGLTPLTISGEIITL